MSATQSLLVLMCTSAKITTRLNSFNLLAYALRSKSRYTQISWTVQKGLRTLASLRICSKKVHWQELCSMPSNTTGNFTYVDISWDCLCRSTSKFTYSKKLFDWAAWTKFHDLLHTEFMYLQPDKGQTWLSIEDRRGMPMPTIYMLACWNAHSIFTSAMITQKENTLLLGVECTTVCLGGTD